ncbi:hypothetical protein KQI84_09355 [bacterium]|nr:hypothetical protein [bacterium]
MKTTVIILSLCLIGTIAFSVWYGNSKNMQDFDGRTMAWDLLPECASLITECRGVALEGEYGFAILEFDTTPELVDCLQFNDQTSQTIQLAHERTGLLARTEDKIAILSFPSGMRNSPSWRNFMREHWDYAKLNDPD